MGRSCHLSRDEVAGRTTYGFDFLQNLVCLGFRLDFGPFHLHHALGVGCESGLRDDQVDAKLFSLW